MHGSSGWWKHAAHVRKPVRTGWCRVSERAVDHRPRTGSIRIGAATVSLSSASLDPSSFPAEATAVRIPPALRGHLVVTYRAALSPAQQLLHAPKRRYVPAPAQRHDPTQLRLFLPLHCRPPGDCLYIEQMFALVIPRQHSAQPVSGCHGEASGSPRPMGGVPAGVGTGRGAVPPLSRQRARPPPERRLDHPAPVRRLLPHSVPGAAPPAGVPRLVGRGAGNHGGSGAGDPAIHPPRKQPRCRRSWSSAAVGCWNVAWPYHRL